MPKFKKGDRVRVRLTSHSPYSGHIGVVDENPSSYSTPAGRSSGFWYSVRFTWRGLHPAVRFREEDLEAVTEETFLEAAPATLKPAGQPRWTGRNRVFQVSIKRKYLLATLAVALALAGGLVAYNNWGIKNSPAASSEPSSRLTKPSLLTGESPHETPKLVFATELVGASAGSAFPVQPAVRIVDADGNIVATSAAPVTLTVTNNRATLYGTTTVNAVNGVATFTDLSIRVAGLNYSLMATSPGLTSCLTNSFDVTPGAAAQLVFIQQPVGGGLGSYFSTEVAILDAHGNLVTDSTAEVTLNITPGSGVPGAVLSGATTQRAKDGVATFSYLSISPETGNYELTATSPGLTSATTRSFNPAKITEKKVQ